MSESLFILNPEIEKYPKRYIWGIGKEAFKILATLTNYRIPVDGFISDDEEEVGLTLINKPVISPDMIEDRNATLILSDRDLQLDYNVLTDIVQFHESFIAKNIVIYGAGYVGEGLVSVLSEKGVKVDCFLDRDKHGQKMAGIPIYPPETIKEMDDNVVILEAGRYWQEMDDVVKKANPRVQAFHEDRILIMDMNIRVCSYSFYTVKSLFLFAESFPDCYADRKVVLLGNDVELSGGYKEILECMGYKKVSMMVTDERIASEDAPLLDEILYENNYLILVNPSNESQAIIEKIEELGIADSDWTITVEPQRFGHGEWMLDINMGYTYTSDYVPGLYLYGREKEGDVKIVTLGGSTTDEEVYLIPSWPKIMFEKYCSENVALYNGGRSCCASLSELIKMIRDVLCIKPDMIVVFDGYNDIYGDYITEFPYVYDIMEYAKEDIFNKHALAKMDKNIFCGINADDAIGKWLRNIESMYAIARVHNMKFYSFMQPMVASQKIHTKHGLSIQKMGHIFHDQEVEDNMRLFRERGKNIEKDHPYIHDLSHIFDEKDVYMDHCHVWESGNEIIADSIWEVIEPGVKEIMEMKAR